MHAVSTPEPFYFHVIWSVIDNRNKTPRYLEPSVCSAQTLVLPSNYCRAQQGLQICLIFKILYCDSSEVISVFVFKKTEMKAKKRLHFPQLLTQSYVFQKNSKRNLSKCQVTMCPEENHHLLWGRARKLKAFLTKSGNRTSIETMEKVSRIYQKTGGVCRLVPSPYTRPCWVTFPSCTSGLSYGLHKTADPSTGREGCAISWRQNYHKYLHF